MGVSEIILNKKRFIFRPMPINICRKTELKSRWTVPLSIPTFLVIHISQQISTIKRQTALLYWRERKSLAYYPHLSNTNWDTYFIFLPWELPVHQLFMYCTVQYSIVIHLTPFSHSVGKGILNILWLCWHPFCLIF